MGKICKGRLCFRAYIAAVGIYFVRVEICFGSLGKIFFNFVGIMSGEILLREFVAAMG